MQRNGMEWNGMEWNEMEWNQPDDETINNNTVTVRDRDTMEQVVVKLDELEDYIKERVEF